MVLPYRGSRISSFFSLLEPSNPSSVLIELARKSQGDDYFKDPAQTALDQIKVASTTTEVIILDSLGRPTRFDFSDMNGAKLTTQDIGNDRSGDLERLLFNLTRSATDMSLKRKNQRPPSSSPVSENVRPAILLSEDKTIRSSAARENIPSISPSALRKYLKMGLGRVRSSSKGSRSSGSGAVTPPSSVAAEQPMDTRP